MRRRPGIGVLQNAVAARDQYRLLGENVAKLRTDLMKEQLTTFRSQLEDFARKHKVTSYQSLCTLLHSDIYKNLQGLLLYAVALFSAMLWLYYAFLKKNAVLLISINSFGCIRHALKLLSLINVGLLSLIFFVSYFAIPNHRPEVVGRICVAVSVSVFAAPLSIFQVVRTRSVEFMPFPLSFFLTLSAVMCFAYGLFQKDLRVALPNVIGFFLGLLQMVLYRIFQNMKPDEIEEKKGPEHVINIMVVGAPEVHHDPVDDDLRNMFKIPSESMPKDAAFQIVNDELMMDGNPRLNLASFVTTWMEPECDKLIMAALNKNYVDMDEYPVTTELQIVQALLKEDVDLRT
ncbi:hypothetical protein CASFOL_006143 [Castilleja foliolosa]|uniref:Uncharacterized protein n=1 Tax=Castilleja foliolosa TaxID=1961234 RepID=A0ABD3E5I1_9LAMI